MDSIHLKRVLFFVFISLHCLAKEWIEHPLLAGYLKSYPVLVIKPLVGGGSYDQIFKIETEKEKWVLRILNPKRSLEKRRAICEATERIGTKKLGPKVIWHDSSYRFLITDFIEGSSLTPQDLQDPLVFQKLVFLVKQAHQVINQMSFSMKVYSLKDRVLQRLKEIPFSFSDQVVVGGLKSFLSDISSTDPQHFCHGDLKGENILKTERDLFLIDWGEVGVSSLYDDLGSISFHFELNKRQEEKLLTLYFGHALQEGMAKTLALHRYLAELHEILLDLRKNHTKTHQ